MKGQIYIAASDEDKVLLETEMQRIAFLLETKYDMNVLQYKYSCYTVV